MTHISTNELLYADDQILIAIIYIETINTDVEHDALKETQCIKCLSSMLEQKGSLDTEINNGLTNTNNIYRNKQKD